MTTVVIADDEVDLVEGLANLLEIKKIDVVGVGYDGKEAAELCTKHNPDVLILDWSMPKFDGFYALEKLQDSKTKIIVLTGMIDEGTLKKLNTFSVLSIQKKPIDIDDLLKIMNSS